MGCIYRRGTMYWIKYYRNGKPFAESSRSDKKVVAERLLKKREGDIASGKMPGIVYDRVKFDDLAEDFLLDYRNNQKKSLDRAKLSLDHLNERFKGLKVPTITTTCIQEYIEKRIEEGALNATINRELSALKRILNLGARQTPPKVERVPYIPMLKEKNIRRGFFEHGDFIAVRNALPEYLKGFATFAYKTGWRKSEIINLRWEQVDLHNGIVRIEAGDTKNDDARTVYLDTELRKIFTRQRGIMKEKQKILPYVFPNMLCTGKIKDFRKGWMSACEKAKIGTRLFHDLRRTAVRNMVRAGVPERVVMMISGHKTRSVFDRYNIVSDSDLQLAIKKQEVYLNSQKTSESQTEDFKEALNSSN